MSNAGDIRAKERRSWATSGELLELVRAKRAEVEYYLSRASRRRRLLTNLVLTGSAVAAVFTAPPAVGGKAFASRMTAVFGAKTQDSVVAVPMHLRHLVLAGDADRDPDAEVQQL